MDRTHRPSSRGPKRDDPRSGSGPSSSDATALAGNAGLEASASSGEPGREGSRPTREEGSEWKEKVIQIRRVTKVVKGGKKLSFRAVVVVGNGKGQVGLGIGKSSEVIGAIQKGVSAAMKHLVVVPIHKTTIPHPIQAKAGGSAVLMRPASEGTGVIAGGAARAVIELAGIENVLSKSLGSNSPLNVARATLQALADLREFAEIARNRGLTVREMLV
jgi:small subunit ribosomal protein S5